MWPIISLMTRPCVYAITNIASGKRYIGSSVYHKRRWALHRSTLKRGVHHNIHLQRSWNKYGEDSFSFSLVKECELDALFERETHHILAAKSGPGSYNIAPVGGSTLGIKLGPKSDEFKKMVSRVHKGKVVSEETRALLSEINRGKKLSEEHKAAISRAGFNRAPPSDETRKKLSERARNITEETRAKRSASCRKSFTAERRAIYAEKARNISEETRAKRAESVKRSWIVRRARAEAEREGKAFPACK